MELLLRIFGFLGLGSVTVAAVVGLAWAAFKVFAGKWLDAKFAERLADYKHAQSLQIESARSQLATLLDRSTKLHAQEFEVLPKAWKKLSRAMGLAADIASAWQSIPNVGMMSPGDLDAFLAESGLYDHEVEEIKAATTGGSRQKLYQEKRDRRRFSKAASAQAISNNYLIFRGIFIEPSLRKMFREVSDLNDEILLDYRMATFDFADSPEGQRDTRATMRENLKAIRTKRDALLDAISARLWSPNADIDSE